MDWLRDVEGAQWLEKTRIVAIVRGIPYEAAIEVADALYAGGIRAFEVTMNTVGASQTIEELRKKYDDKMWIGAGTVWNMKSALEAKEAGAQFFVTPNVDEKVIEFGVRNDIPVISGSLTPSEVVRAYQAGAALVKIFPVSSMGAHYLQELQGPLSHIPMIAVGGISAENAAEYMEAGAWGVGIGGKMVDKKAIAEKRFDVLRLYATRLVKVVQDSVKR